jgi:hypothetical protein
MNVLLRTVFSKPEMLYLSLKYEQVAREYFDDDYFTIFAVDYGADSKCLEVIKDYKFVHEIIQRPTRHFVCANVMEGLKTACQRTSDFVINMEDDVILHRTFFKFVRMAHDLVKDRRYSVITPWGYSAFGDPSILKLTDFSCGPGTMINKNFFERYMLPCATQNYYKNWATTVDEINKLNAPNPNAKYSIAKNNTRMHMDWDGVMNRLVDYASFNEDVRSYSSLCYRLLHVGFYGFNRHGRYPSGIASFEDRKNFLEAHIFDPDVLSKLDGMYKDYQTFDAQLDNWDGSLRLEV